MKKLDDIPKKQIFDVPDGYFEKLPGIIQARVSPESAPRFSMARFSLRYALPAVILLVAGIFWFTRIDSDVNAENMLADIETQDLIAYLSESDISTEELIDEVNLDQNDIDDMVDHIYEVPLGSQTTEDLLDDIDL
jgi:hypothetical protein